MAIEPYKRKMYSGTWQKHMSHKSRKRCYDDLSGPDSPDSGQRPVFAPSTSAGEYQEEPEVEPEGEPEVESGHSAKRPRSEVRASGTDGDPPQSPDLAEPSEGIKQDVGAKCPSCESVVRDCDECNVQDPSNYCGCMRFHPCKNCNTKCCGNCAQCYECYDSQGGRACPECDQCSDPECRQLVCVSCKARDTRCHDCVDLE